MVFNNNKEFSVIDMGGLIRADAPLHFASVCSPDYIAPEFWRFKNDMGLWHQARNHPETQMKYAMLGLATFDKRANDVFQLGVSFAEALIKTGDFAYSGRADGTHSVKQFVFQDECVIVIRNYLKTAAKVTCVKISDDAMRQEKRRRLEFNKNVYREQVASLREAVKSTFHERTLPYIPEAKRADGTNVDIADGSEDGRRRREEYLAFKSNTAQLDEYWRHFKTRERYQRFRPGLEEKERMLLLPMEDLEARKKRVCDEAVARMNARPAPDSAALKRIDQATLSHLDALHKAMAGHAERTRSEREQIESTLNSMDEFHKQFPGLCIENNIFRYEMEILNHVGGDVNYLQEFYYFQALREIIDECMRFDPETRPTVDILQQKVRRARTMVQQKMEQHHIQSAEWKKADIGAVIDFLREPGSADLATAMDFLKEHEKRD